MSQARNNGGRADQGSASARRKTTELADRVATEVSFFRELWPDQPVKMTLSQYTFDQLAAGVKNITGLGLRAGANVVFEDVWGPGK